MAEINNVIAEASQDLQTIEDFVNLPADSEVYPRLLPSVNVGTLAGARQAIFEAGGLPAKPFATKALMTASALIDGDYAQVTDDSVADDNGLYVKTAGVWIKSKYNPLLSAKSYTDEKVKGTTHSFSTKALLTESSLSDDIYALVTSDPDDANNGLYVKKDGVWSLTEYNPASSTRVEGVENMLAQLNPQTSKNLFRPNYYPYDIEWQSDDNSKAVLFVSKGVSDNATAIQQVEPSTTYTIKYNAEQYANHFRLALYDNKPVAVGGRAATPSEYGKVVLFNQYATEATFTTSSSQKWLVLRISPSGGDPLVQLEKSPIATPYAPPLKLPKTPVEDLSKNEFPLIVHKGRNLFNGEYLKATISDFSFGNYLKENFSKYDGRVARVPVKRGVSYTISIKDSDISKSNVFRAGTSREYFSEPINTGGGNYNSAYKVDLITKTRYASPVTFKALYDGYVYIYVSNVSNEVGLQVEEGTVATAYQEIHAVDEMYLPKLITESLVNSNNLFDGVFNDFIINFTSSDVTQSPQPYLIKSGVGTGRHGLSCVLPISGRGVVTASLHDTIPDGIVSWALFTTDELKVLDAPVTTDTPDVESALGRTGSELSSGSMVSTVRATAEDKWLVFQVSTAKSPRKVQIVAGEIAAKEYKANKVIPAELLEISRRSEASGGGGSVSLDNSVKIPETYPADWWGLESLPSRLKQIRKYNYSVDLTGTFTKEGELENYFTDPDGMTALELQNRFLELVDEFPDDLKATYIGDAERGHQMYKYETLPKAIQIDKSSYISDMGEAFPLEQPTFFITSGVHGNERVANYAVYYFLEELFKNPQNDPALEFMRNNVKFVIIPLVSPSGFDANRYGNINMNTNRDFPPFGEATQAETRIVMSELLNTGHIDYHFDFHTSAAQANSLLGYAFTDYRELNQGAIGVYQDVGVQWAKQFPDVLSSNPKSRFGWSSLANVGTVGKYSQDILGIRSMIFEIYQWPDKGINAGQPNHSKTLARLGLDVMVNMVKMGLRYIIV